MNIISKWNLKKHTLISIIIVVLYTIIDYFFVASMCSASIGIIGGADGPTAMFTTSGKNLVNVIFNKYIVVLIILMLLYKPIMLLKDKVLNNK